VPGPIPALACSSPRHAAPRSTTSTTSRRSSAAVNRLEHEAARLTDDERDESSPKAVLILLGLADRYEHHRPGYRGRAASRGTRRASSRAGSWTQWNRLKTSAT
jgi:hypothetical protein